MRHCSTNHSARRACGKLKSIIIMALVLSVLLTSVGCGAFTGEWASHALAQQQTAAYGTVYAFTDRDGDTHYRVYGSWNGGVPAFYAFDNDNNALLTDENGQPVTADPATDFQSMSVEGIAQAIDGQIVALPTADELAAMDVSGAAFANAQSLVLSINSQLQSLRETLASEDGYTRLLSLLANYEKLSALNDFFKQRVEALNNWASGFISAVGALPAASEISAMTTHDGDGAPDVNYEAAKTADVAARTLLLERPRMTETELAELQANEAMTTAVQKLADVFAAFEGKELPVINNGIDSLPTVDEANAKLIELTEAAIAAGTFAPSDDSAAERSGGSENAIEGSTGITNDSITDNSTTVETANATPLYPQEVIAYLDDLWTAVQDIEARIMFLTGDITDDAAYEDYLNANIGEERMAKYYDLYDMLDALMGGSLLPSLYATKTSLDADEAYITKLEVSSIKDGTEPFDGDDAAGNDSGEANKIVRSFDSVKYTVKATTASYASGDNYKAARARFEVVLPCTKDQAEFDTAAMGWMLNGGDYQWEVTESDGKQILTCWREIPANSFTGIALPGSFDVEVYVKVKGMANGATVQPAFSAAMEHNTWDGECPTHNRQEKASVTPEAVTVSAAPKYNIKIGEGSLYSYKDTLVFNTGNELAANKGDYTVNGRVIPYGAVIQLYNDNASKGLKGIELPQGDITFTLNVSSAYNKSDGGTVNTTDEGYKPLLWSYEGNADGDTQADGRVLNGSEKYANGADVPLNKQGDARYSCYDGGSYTAVQNGNQIAVTVKDYKIDTDKFPDYVWWSNLTGTPHFGEYVGCISAGEFWIVQPYVNTDSGTDAATEFSGAGTFTTTVEATDLKMTSVSGQKQEDDAGTNNAQIVKDDDSAAATTYLSLPGGMDNRAYYTYFGNTDFIGHGINSYPSFEDGSDYAVVGESIGIVGGFVYTANGETDNRLEYATSLLKFDADAIALTGGVYRHGDVGDCGLTPTVLYAAKPDGSNWTSDAELQSATEDDLVFHTSIPQGSACVAVLLIYTGPANKIDGYIEARTMLQAKVKDGSVWQETYMLTETSRVWTSANLREANMTLAEIPNWTDTGTKLDDFPVNRYELKYNYVKETYDESGLKGTHTGAYQQGDSLLVIGLKTGITKKLAQTVNGEEKTVYDLDNSQRVVDYILQPSTISAAFGEGTRQTTVTVVDTLPKHLTYRRDSAYFGGTYTQTSVNGGTQGSVTGGTQTEPVSANNADGTQTLTWDISVTVGEIMPAIYYSCDIGRTDGGEDVPNAAQLVNTARIYAPEDMRQPSESNGNLAEKGIQVTKLSATSFAKTAKENRIEANGTASYTIFYGNNASGAISDLVFMDTMPFSDDALSSKFTGSYTISGWKMDMSELSGSTLALYYTYNSAYKDATVDNKGLVASNFPGTDWTKAAIDSDGNATLPSNGGKPPVAWALVGMLAGYNTVHVELEMKLAPENAADSASYVNTISIKGNSTTAEVKTVLRQLSGLTWLDADRDGVREDGETLQSGVKVTLMKLKDGETDVNLETNYEPYIYTVNGTGKPATTTTGKQLDLISGEESDLAGGKYLFSGLPAGTFAVKFESGDTFNLAQYVASPANVSGVSDTSDSDGLPVYDGDHKLDHTFIPNIVMPAAKDMNVTLYTSANNDSGFDILRTDVTLGKMVGGNAGDRAKAFDFTITIRDGGNTPAANTTFTCEGGVQAGVSGVTAPTINTITTDASGQATVQLAHGQNVKIKGLPMTYDVQFVESLPVGEGYATKYTYTVGTRTVANNVSGVDTDVMELNVSKHIEDGVIETQSAIFTNERSITVPTGVWLDIWPYLVIVLAATLGIATLLLCGKRRHCHR